MRKKNTIAELLYYISNYEKCRMDTTSHWSKKYVVSLTESLDVISMLLNTLIGRENDNTIDSINSFLNKNDGIIVSDAHSFVLEKCKTSSQEVIFLDDDEKSIVNLMVSIAGNCRHAVLAKKNDYKKLVSNSLRAFHNLPRALFDEHIGTIRGISCEEAMEYAQSYLQ